ncbi:ribonucleoside-diphosphate reductase subunit alpha [Nakamurella aerolata]|uniref:Ribonucleoside-diphosphate reductase n=1 Tax=Nakamurella aerolata TaxID=1656892 RepID=A0A849A4V7_9ACTN|nr:ribonucleoside-diphosphate reductase subunit alpha [Nakamurella aerolata]NNG36024.1 ribonucleoside-diphosphate reductase subunit alpha [Nakamurella aerolata]
MPEAVDTGLTVQRRDGEVVPFDPGRIAVAVTKAFLAVEGEAAQHSTRLRAQVRSVTDAVLEVLTRRQAAGRPLDLEAIQDQVELALMRAEQPKVARAYILYREQHRQAREERARQASAPAQPAAPQRPVVHVTAADGTRAPLDTQRLVTVITEACQGLSDADPQAVLTATDATVYDGISVKELQQAPVLAARTLVEREPAYSTVAARLLADSLRSEALSFLSGSPESATAADMAERYPGYFAGYIQRGIELEQLDPQLAEFDLDALGAAIEAERDLDFTYLGLQTLYDRYFLHHRGTRYELPQAFFMRVAMGLAVREIDRDAAAIEFYRLLSSFDFMCSTPTLFNSGTTRPQLSSCFLTTVDDDLSAIFAGIRDNALLAKFSGGLGNDWTPVRGIGAHIKGTNGNSSGVVPFLKIANDTAVAVNQGGKRKGAVCAYLETWHVDIEEFLELRRNTGDDRRRTHDMNTANWVPDEFLRRVESGEQWTLFSPDEVPDLHDLYGTAFAERYREYEAAADRGELRVFRRVPALDLWRKMLTALFETGHPWITFKDACNLRSPQQHVGVVHSSNLCTEITLNTKPGVGQTRDGAETAVCNLGSVNLAAHVRLLQDGPGAGTVGLDTEKLRRTVTTAVRMLDNVIDINLYTIPSARRSNLSHRPVGLGLMGFADCLYRLGIPYASDAAVAFADESMEQLSYWAISASSDLAVQRGRYPSFEGSLWSRGVLPIDSIELLAEARGGELQQDRTQRMDWDALRSKVISQGMRNSNVMAIAPTATISNIVGVSQSIEPTYRNLFVKSNMSGDFTVINEHLVAELKRRDLWDEVMVGDLKYFDGSLWEIDRIPADVKELFATAFEIHGSWLIQAASRRQKWLDQAQSLNLYIAAPSGRDLDELYRMAWHTGCKTTYYLRSTSATHVEKSTLRGTDGKLNAVSANASAAPSASAAMPSPGPIAATPAAAAPSASAGKPSPGPIAATPAVTVPAASAAMPSPSASVAASDIPTVLPGSDVAACSIDNPDCEACQ